MLDARQTPEPGAHRLAHCGDDVEFTLRLGAPAEGHAWLRTNVGRAAVRREEIIRHVEEGLPVLARDWHDVPMRPTGDGRYAVRLPLVEVGVFEAKAFFMRQPSGDILWPEGPNVSIKVEPADTCCDNTIYCAFVRQFGPYQRRRTNAEEPVQGIHALEEAGYAVIPRSGTFRDLIRELDFILGTLGFRAIQLLPIHPTPTVFGRMGRFGSPFAVLDFLAVDPALAEFDRRTTPLDQFHELADAIHRRHARLFIDIPVNHTGWSSWLQMRHPEWFARDPSRAFRSPGAWGVTWEDLSQLDYSQRRLWEFMAGVFLYWCRQGVDGFRCDAGYMVPREVWVYIVAKVRRGYPDTVFLLEGLGGPIQTVESLLADADLNWAYSELFQNYSREQIDGYLPGCIGMSSAKGLMLHFAETHDNDRLAARSRPFARLRTALAALCSQNGGFGITNGVEWFADEKIDVHGAGSLNWGEADNQTESIARLNALLEYHPCFHAGANLSLIHRPEGQAIALRRISADTSRMLLALANLDERHPGSVAWRAEDFAVQGPLVDLLTGKPVGVSEQDGVVRCSLRAAEAMCLTASAGDLEGLQAATARGDRQPERVLRQRLRAKALEIHRFFRQDGDLAGLDPDALAGRLAADVRGFCSERARTAHAPVVSWLWPRDIHREVTVPPGHLLCVSASREFVVEIREGERVVRRESSLRQRDGTTFVLLAPADGPGAQARRLTLALTVYEPDGCRRSQSPLLWLPTWRNAKVQRTLTGAEVRERDSYALCTNGVGGMAQVRGAWGEISSQYDAILAGNLHPDYPVDRRIMFTRCRGWLAHRGYSRQIDRECLKSFSAAGGDAAVWEFELPAGLGKMVALRIHLRMKEGRNGVSLEFARHSTRSREHLPDDMPVRLILRPDIEDRVSHEQTKAYLGPEARWPQDIRCASNGFVFAPDRGRRLRLFAPGGTFTWEPEWAYMVPHPVEASRGLADASDLFSPGYFTLNLTGGQRVALQADMLREGEADPDGEAPAAPDEAQADSVSLADAMRVAMSQFLVKRGNSRTIIAGYPWFLDWGRDTLIALRGVVAAGWIETAMDILRTFARFESSGTLPNVIHGDDVSNRDTSDAPLWFFRACGDVFDAQSSLAFAETDCGGRTIRDVLVSIASACVEGTPNGIRMDPGTGLLFSPAHFTWMDTNFPAGTPREGYPIEIEALWLAALELLARIDSGGRWGALATRVRESIRALFTGDPSIGLSDCLHAAPGVAASEAVADDALRPNQLLAITLGAVTDREVCARILAACEELLVPGAIRSLADRPVRRPLAIHHAGRLLNDPLRPYWGQYAGDEDTRRKPAYHNGTAWTWLFPSYSEALFLTYGEKVRDMALSILCSSAEIVNRGCVGQVPEILDGHAPHAPRGCGAQAWGATELYRVLALLGGSG